MTIAEIQEAILTSDVFVLEEAKRIRYLYGLRDVIRYNRTRPEEIYTQSVAEHSFNMQIIAQYFLLLEDTDSLLDTEKISRMIIWHDIGEIESGDVLGFFKTTQDKVNDKVGNDTVVSLTSEVLKRQIQSLLDEYEAQTTPEAQFVKALDKVEVIFEILDTNYKKIFQLNKTTTEHNTKTKYPYVNEYPFIRRFTDVVSAHLTEQGFFVDKPNPVTTEKRP